MKTLTELSGTLVRMAARAIQEAKRSLPSEEPPPAAPADAPAAEAAPAETPPAEAASGEAAVPPEAAAEGAPEEASAEAPVAAKRPPARTKAREEEETEAVKATLDAAVAAATGLSGDRLARLRDAVKASGPRTDDVRLVRVFGMEEPVAGAKTIGEFQYLVDHSPASMAQTHAPKKERGGRGGGPGGGGGRPGGGGKGAPTSGGFSMDSLRDDRKGSRGGGKPGGGGRTGGGRPK
jgi:translation initiation factor IF-2